MTELCKPFVTCVQRTIHEGVMANLSGLQRGYMRSKSVSILYRTAKNSISWRTPIVQTDASDYGKVLVIRYFSEVLQEMLWYLLYYGVKQFEDLLDNRHFILKTDHKNLTYINVTLTG